MNALLETWLLSLAAAVLFFAAGSAWAMRRSALRERESHKGEEGALANTARERDDLRAALFKLEREHAGVAEAASERDRLRAANAKVEKAAREANARAERAGREVATLVAELRKPKPRILPPVHIDAGARADALRDVLDQETSGNGFTGAVITDGMGLIVASTGEYGDALAAYGAFLAGIGAKTRDALPLHELRQVIVQDDHDTTLTVRPIVSADDNLALVTLSPGRQNGSSAGESLER